MIYFGDAAREWLARQTGCARGELKIVRLKGSTSSSVYFLECGDGSSSNPFVLRVIDNPEWLADEPDLAAREAAALVEAERAGLRAPRLVAFSNEDVRFGAPVVLMTFLEGRVELNPSDFAGWLDGMARELAKVHRHRADGLTWEFRSWVDEDHLDVPAWTRVPEVWEQGIKLWKRGAPNDDLVFIHRDYHPTNVLWKDGAVSGVVDWINGCRGPAGVDVAHCRTNLAQIYGVEAADGFLKAYLENAGGYEYNVCWDLDSVLDMALPSPTYYAPWKEFGLPVVTVEEMRGRVDTYLGNLLSGSRYT